MMSKTHIAFGVATSLLITQPQTTTGCLVAVLGGSIGGLISDIDTRSNKHCRDALYGRLIVLGITVLILLTDRFNGMQILGTILDPQRQTPVLMGTVLLGTTCVFGIFSDHRTFTHSFLALILMGSAVYMICPMLFTGFAIGFLSHLTLDIFNKKPIRLLYPKDWGFCLKLCYANGIADKVLMAASCGIALLLLAYFLFIN